VASPFQRPTPDVPPPTPYSSDPPSHWCWSGPVRCVRNHAPRQPGKQNTPHPQSGAVRRTSTSVAQYRQVWSSTLRLWRAVFKRPCRPLRRTLNSTARGSRRGRTETGLHSSRSRCAIDHRASSRCARPRSSHTSTVFALSRRIVERLVAPGTGPVGERDHVNLRVVLTDTRTRFESPVTRRARWHWSYPRRTHPLIRVSVPGWQPPVDGEAATLWADVIPYLEGRTTSATGVLRRRLRCRRSHRISARPLPQSVEASHPSPPEAIHTSFPLSGTCRRRRRVRRRSRQIRRTPQGYQSAACS
jgi:hypothetical protein